MPMAADVRFGSKTDLTPETFDVRSYLNSKHALRQSNVMEHHRPLSMSSAAHNREMDRAIALAQGEHAVITVNQVDTARPTTSLFNTLLP
jgi:hypothetical protein